MKYRESPPPSTGFWIFNQCSTMIVLPVVTVEEVHGGDVLEIDSVGFEKRFDVFVEPRLVPQTHRVQLLGVVALVHEEPAHDHP